MSQVMDDPLDDIFMPEMVVTQSRGMARWIAVRLAEEQGISANIDFKFPAAFFWDLFVRFVGPEHVHSPFEKASMQWSIYQLLQQLRSNKGFDAVDHFLQNDDGEMKRLQLSQKMAYLFDRYLNYRPQMIQQWEEDEGNGANFVDWQRALWQELINLHGHNEHRASLLHQLFKITPTTEQLAQLPKRISIFGISSLPPKFIELIGHLSQWIDIHLFVMNPSYHYWGDIVNEKAIARFRLRRKENIDDYLTSGHPLLASLGKQGRDFIDYMQNIHADELDYFVEPEPNNLLSQLQSDILNLEQSEQAVFNEDDRSIQIHSCHSPMREVEVLHDQLLELFNNNHELTPDSVVVMTTDLEKYAPCFKAVFSQSENYIPWSIADQSRLSDDPLIEVFLSLLSLPESRFSATEIMGLLECDEVMSRFAIKAEDIPTIRGWIEHSGIRWGIDGEMREASGVSNWRENSWEFGFDRLFMGYACWSDDAHLVNDIAPLDHIDGQSGELLGKLRAFYETLIRFRKMLKREHSLSQWVATIRHMIDALFKAEDDYKLTAVMDILNDIQQSSSHLNPEPEIGLKQLTLLLKQALSEPQLGHRFMSGKVTLCAIEPMRALPFKVVAMLGMGDGIFPVQTMKSDLDKMELKPEKGDKNRRDDERYHFLESILSAREVFYISYVGRNISDNSLKLPSMVVQELLDTLKAQYGSDISSHVVTEHPLQAFSPRYYDQSELKLFSYNRAWLSETENNLSTEFIQAPLPVNEAITEISVNQLLYFYTNPSRYFVEQRLGIVIENGDAELESDERFNLSGLDRYNIQHELLNHLIDDGAVEPWLEMMHAKGELPYGALTQGVIDHEIELVEQLKQLITAQGEYESEPVEIDITINGITINGWVDSITEQGQVLYRPGTIKSRQLMQFWIKHLLLNSGEQSYHSYFYDENGCYQLPPIKDVYIHLEVLIAYFLKAQQQPLPLFAATSYEYAKAAKEEKGDPLKEAQKRWFTHSYSSVPGEADDPYISMLWSDDALNEDFAVLADLIMGPVVENAVYEEHVK